MAEAELDCDVCGMSVDSQHLYQLSVTHGNLREEFEFCSMACLARWTKQYAEDQRRASAAKLEQSLSADDGTDGGDTDGNADLQDLEEEVLEHEAETPAGKPYPLRVTPAYADAANVAGADDADDTGYADGKYIETRESNPFDDLVESTDKPAAYSPQADAAIDRTPVTDFIEEMDPAEKGKREQAEREQQEREQLQEQHEESEDPHKPA